MDFSTIIGIAACVYGIFIIIKPLSKDSKSAKGIKEIHLPAYSRKAGLLLVVFGVIFLLYVLLGPSLQHNIWFSIITLCLIAFIAILQIRLKRKYKNML